MKRTPIRMVVLFAAFLAYAFPAGAAPAPGLGLAAGRPASGSAAVKAAVKPYRVSPTLKEVANARRFRGTPEQKKLLAQNLFVVTPTDAQQLFFLYENNDYANIPSFVTTDLVLQLYHVFYDFTLRQVETEKLVPLLDQLTRKMLAQAVSTWKNVTDPALKDAALKNVAYFAVAADLLGVKGDVPAEAQSAVSAELALVDKHEGFELGRVFPYKIDYSQFVPRGHYTRSEALKRYFRAMMWYGLAPFAFYRQVDGGLDAQGNRIVKLERCDEVVRMGLLMARGLAQANLLPTWERIYEPTAFYVGLSDDLTPAEYKALMDQVFGKEAPISAYTDPARFDAFVARGKQLRQPLIKPRVEHPGTRRHPAEMLVPILFPFPDPATAQLRFMGQRYIPDSQILQNVSTPYERFFPSGMDVMAVLGSQRARALLDTAFPDTFNTRKRPEYRAERAKLEAAFAGLDEAKWTRNMYWGWLWAIQGILQPAPQGYPSFMRNNAWLDKSLNTALASWAELRHDTLLYGKQSVTVAECGGDGEAPPVPKGYVEPNVEFYRRLIVLTRLSKEGLSRRNLLSKELTEKFTDLEDLLVFLRRVSEKELANRKLTRQEYDQIRIIGAEVERLTLSVVEGKVSSWEEITSPVDRDMAVVADVHTGGEAPKIMALEEGVGHASEILAIVPVEGKLQITRGAVFSYYEFLQPQDDRLTDEKWQELLKSGKGPKPPIWTRTFLSPTGKVKGTNEPATMSVETYSTGC